MVRHGAAARLYVIKHPELRPFDPEIPHFGPKSPNFAPVLLDLDVRVLRRGVFETPRYSSFGGCQIVLVVSKQPVSPVNLVN